ncbi:MAG: histidine kinase [Candidatus Aminicenantes bacterium]|nr:histidine kinase [Candidatus Aminicenantes bacterium]
MTDPKARRRLFWVFQTSGWLCYLAFAVFTYQLSGSLTKALLVSCVRDVLIGFLLTLGLHWPYRKIKTHDHSILTLVLRTFVLSFLAANIAAGITALFPPPSSSWEMPGAGLTLRSHLVWVISWMAILIMWSALYFGIRFWQEWMIQKDRADKAKALAEAAQLQMLRYRMSPHFLFNTLNSIRALISENKASAKTMITELSEYLRYSLVSKKYESVPFKDELESVRHYLTIQKMRYEDKLEVSWDINPEAEEFPVPSFLLHPLVENAIKYGLSTSPLPLRIQVKADAPHGRLRIDVVNSGSWVEPSAPEKGPVIVKGLDNVRRRLAEAYSGKHQLEVLEKEGSVHVRLTIGEGGGR